MSVWKLGGYKPMLSLSRIQGLDSPASPSPVLLEVSGGLILTEGAKSRLCREKAQSIKSLSVTSRAAKPLTANEGKQKKNKVINVKTHLIYSSLTFLSYLEFPASAATSFPVAEVPHSKTRTETKWHYYWWMWLSGCSPFSAQTDMEGLWLNSTFNLIKDDWHATSSLFLSYHIDRLVCIVNVTLLLNPFSVDQMKQCNFEDKIVF